ncbi:hypothetical protein [Hoeflea ulvae]|uniref:Uncharacterized protein n=1 Tax=Hoeflea ulvae TaxID=2983764 RepID=A0ABT3YGM5_9HYPH|nr:hypothetical protein [Hoeflea ulvae]MCY0095050.1 hypothetical protein [Hoeflea ulvae]
MAVLLSDVLMKRSRDRAARPFLTPDQIRNVITQSVNYPSHDGTDPARARALLLFQTSVQQTWLVRTERRLYCILDDRRKPTAHINWSMAMSEIVHNDDLLLEISLDEQSPVSSKSGLVHFGPSHRNWLYSKKLFASEPLAEQLDRFLRGA